jgi:hypothetical protein
MQVCTASLKVHQYFQSLCFKQFSPTFKIIFLSYYVIINEWREKKIILSIDI